MIHKMTLSQPYYDMIKNNMKTVEIRILDEKRKLLNININQGKKELKETENLFESLMGKKAEYRFKFIQENANFADQIDI